MTRDECTHAAWQGWRLGKSGLGAAEMRDIMEIGRLNRRATAAWERENSSGGQEPTASRASRATLRAATAATALASGRGWRLDMSGGLWWLLDVPWYDGNALSGLQ